MRVLNQLTSLCLMVIMVLTSLQTFKLMEQIESEVSMSFAGATSKDMRSSGDVGKVVSLINESVGSARGFLDKVAALGTSLFKKVEGLLENIGQQPPTSKTQQQSKSPQ